MIPASEQHIPEIVTSGTFSSLTPTGICSTTSLHHLINLSLWPALHLPHHPDKQAAVPDDRGQQCSAAGSKARTSNTSAQVITRLPLHQTLPWVTTKHMVNIFRQLEHFPIKNKHTYTTSKNEVLHIKTTIKPLSPLWRSCSMKVLPWWVTSLESACPEGVKPDKYPITVCVCVNVLPVARMPVLGSDENIRPWLELLCTNNSLSLSLTINKDR